MKGRNICKFVSPGASDVLEVQNFVYETNPEIMTAPVSYGTHRMVLVTKGEGTFVIGLRNWHGKMGSLFFSFGGETVRVENSTNLEYIYISFAGERAERLFRQFGIDGENRLFEGFDRLIPLWKECLLRASEENTDLCAESMLLYAFSRLSAVREKMHVLLQNMIDITERSFTDPGFSLSNLAEEMGYNMKYLSHLFRKHMGVTYTEYLSTMRIRYAVTLFDHGIDSVKNVAFLCGFRDPLYFSTVFKKIVGDAPSSYRNKKE